MLSVFEIAFPLKMLDENIDLKIIRNKIRKRYQILILRYLLLKRFSSAFILLILFEIL